MKSLKFRFSAFSRVLTSWNNSSVLRLGIVVCGLQNPLQHCICAETKGVVLRKLQRILGFPGKNPGIPSPEAGLYGVFPASNHMVYGLPFFYPTQPYARQNLHF
jgi:hypothetical protein